MNGRDFRGIQTPKFKPPEIPGRTVAVVGLLVLLVVGIAIASIKISRR